MKRQLAFQLARSNVPIEWVTPVAAEGSDEEPAELDETLAACISNTRLSEFFRFYGKELDVSEPKSLEDVYKSHLENTRPSTLPFVSSVLTTAGTDACHTAAQDRPCRSTLPGQTLLARLSTPLSTLASATTSSWLRPRRAAAGSTRTRTTVRRSPRDEPFLGAS
jgi:hypothetical protein